MNEQHIINPTPSQLKAAIRSHCKGCIYDAQASGDWITQVEGCTVKNCELYNLRPMTKATRDKLNEERIAAMSPTERATYERRRENGKKQSMNLKSNVNA
jgi:hypothetical protein